MPTSSRDMVVFPLTQVLEERSYPIGKNKLWAASLLLMKCGARTATQYAIQALRTLRDGRELLRQPTGGRASGHSVFLASCFVSCSISHPPSKPTEPPSGTLLLIATISSPLTQVRPLLFLWTWAPKGPPRLQSPEARLCSPRLLLSDIS